MNLPLHPEFLAQSKRRRYLVAISGGRDSVALLHALLDAGYHNLILCHLNHSLRGADSGLDASFVRRLATKHQLPCEIDRVDVMDTVEQSDDSMELAARRARHVFFARCARNHRCSRIILGHHADDQAETILFNLLRGSGGLKGMQHCSHHQIDGKNLSMIRPLIGTSREEIDLYMREHEIKFREDSSNAQPIATRNRIRNEVMPLLTEIMGRQIRPAILRATNISNMKDQALNDMLAPLQLEDPQGRLFLPKLTPLPSALQSMALHHYLKQQGCHNISEDLLHRCCNLIHQTQLSKINLPGGQFFRRKEKRLFVSSQ